MVVKLATSRCSIQSQAYFLLKSYTVYIDSLYTVYPETDDNSDILIICFPKTLGT